MNLCPRLQVEILVFAGVEMQPTLTFKVLPFVAIVLPPVHVHAATVAPPVVAKNGKPVDLIPIRDLKTQKRCLFPAAIKSGSTLKLGDCKKATAAWSLVKRGDGMQIRLATDKSLCLGVFNRRQIKLKKCGSAGDLQLSMGPRKFLRRIGLKDDASACLSSTTQGKAVIRRCATAWEWIIKKSAARGSQPSSVKPRKTKSATAKLRGLPRAAQSYAAVAIRPKSSNKNCLIIGRGSLARGIAAKCTPKHRGWRMAVMRDGNVRITDASNSKKCLQRSGREYLTAGSCNKNKGQWKIERVKAGYRIHPSDAKTSCLTSNPRGSVSIVKVEANCKGKGAIWSLTSYETTSSSTASLAPASHAMPELAPAPATVRFGFNKWRAGCRKISCRKIQKELKAIAQQILANAKPGSTIELHGHADYIGSKYVNQWISEMRAKSVRRWLMRYGGLSGFRIIVKAFGESRPLNKARTRQARRVNRRVEIRYASS